MPQSFHRGQNNWKGRKGPDPFNWIKLDLDGHDGRILFVF